MSQNTILLMAKVIPQGKFNRVEQVSLDEKGEICIKVRVTAPPTDGKANDAVIKVLAEYYKISKSSFLIKSGWSGRNKTIVVSGVEKDTLLKGMQKSLFDCEK